MYTNLTAKRAAEGELLIRRMSAKAQEYFNSTDTIKVYADDRNDVENIDVKDVDGVRDMTFDELQAELEALQDEIEKGAL